MFHARARVFAHVERRATVACDVLIGRRMQKKKTNRKLVLKKDTLRSLDDDKLRRASGAANPLTLGPLCWTAWCTLTFTPDCNSANCMTLGGMCPSNDCQLTFTGCYKA